MLIILTENYIGITDFNEKNVSFSEVSMPET